MAKTDARTAIITGASRGIGLAERLAKDGFSVVIDYSSDAAPAGKLAREIEAAGRRALPVKADVSDPAAIRRMFEAAETTFGTDLFFKGKSKELIDQFAKLTLLERLGLPRDIAYVVAFLAGPDGGWIDRQVLRANGGII
jgi:NAD(P)-dependent dehydrogenase (short-subunit alcohol dehydrogenase family)